MKEDFISLKKEFRRIKNMGLIETMRKGGSGIGYTLETLLNKKEDQECKPDFKSIYSHYVFLTKYTILKSQNLRMASSAIVLELVILSDQL